MADYIGAFRQGLEAAEVAEIAKKEINNVFVEFNEQMRKASEGKIGIERKEFYVRVEGIAAFTGLPYSLSGKKRETYWAIVAYNPLVPGSPEKELATWSQGRAGYPCKIVFENISLSCDGRQSLEGSLAELLRDPIVGEKLCGLMGLEPPSPKERNSGE